MIYAKHNFAENFINADGLTFGLDRDMVISELAKVNKCKSSWGERRNF